jgi:hypothetical protein
VHTHLAYYTNKYGYILLNDCRIVFPKAKETWGPIVGFMVTPEKTGPIFWAWGTTPEAVVYSGLYVAFEEGCLKCEFNLMDVKVKP